MTRFENATLKMLEKYTPSQLAIIDCKIRQLSTEHYKYGNMPLVYGKAYGIQEILRVFYGIKTTIYYVWGVIEHMNKEPQE